MNDLSFRYSRESDADGVVKLMEQRFGVREDVLVNLPGRYYLAIDSNNEIVAMTGLSRNTKYNGLEIDWTCVDYRYCNRGLITHMIRTLITNVDKDVYCSCWRISSKPINLRHAMITLGFTPAIIGRVSQSTEFCNCGNKCVVYNGGICKCYEDLWVRRVQ